MIDAATTSIDDEQHDTRFVDLVRRLSEQSVVKHFDAYADVDWDAPEMAIDRHDTPGLYFGTSTGQLFASTDEGESWTELADHLPPIWSVEVAQVD